MFFRDTQKVAQQLDILINKVELPLSISDIPADQSELETEPEKVKKRISRLRFGLFPHRCGVFRLKIAREKVKSPKFCYFCISCDGQYHTKMKFHPYLVPNFDSRPAHLYEILLILILQWLRLDEAFLWWKSSFWLLHLRDGFELRKSISENTKSGTINELIARVLLPLKRKNNHNPNYLLLFLLFLMPFLY